MAVVNSEVTEGATAAAGSRCTVTLIPGDGIGPEVTEAARLAVDASGAAIHWQIEPAGTETFEREGTALPDRVIESVARSGVALKGPLSTSAELGYGSPSVALREALRLHTTIRPCRALEGVRTARAGVDVVIVKMNQEDLYARLGWPRGGKLAGAAGELLAASGQPLPDDSAASIKPLSAPAARRVVDEAFRFASRHGRSRVTAVHKAPLIPHTDGMFVEVAREVSGSHPDVSFDDALVDTVCERLVSKPSSYDVLVMQRTYGDIVSGVAAALIGGAGMAPGVNLGEGCAVFEAAHGSAPRLAGSGRANPLALIMCATLMLRHIGQLEPAERLERAVARTVERGTTLTYDLRPEGEPASTAAVTDAVIAALEADPR